jgi:hypothetical protein
MSDSTPILTTPQPPVTGRTNLATVTYPVILATDSQRGQTTDATEMLWNVPNSKPVIDQFSILLTRKNLPLRQGSRHLPVFSRLNQMKCCGKNMKPNDTKSKKKMRVALQKDLKFAGIAFTGVEDGNGDGAPKMIASVIGGSHTVMSYRNNHSNTPLRPGSTVRWTLPKVDEQMTAANVPPVRFHGASGNGVFAELEEVTPESTENAIQEIFSVNDENVDKLKQNIFKCTTEEQFKTHSTAIISELLQIIQSVQEREIGVVIQDNGKGSIDIRLK